MFINKHIKSCSPGAALSLQSHKHRYENWIVVERWAVVTIDESVRVICSGQSTYVPLGSIHRLENKEKNMLIIIEVQIGVYLGEDDIIRYEDVYSRKWFQIVLPLSTFIKSGYWIIKAPGLRSCNLPFTQETLIFFGLIIDF